MGPLAPSAHCFPRFPLAASLRYSSYPERQPEVKPGLDSWLRSVNAMQDGAAAPRGARCRARQHCPGRELPSCPSIPGSPQALLPFQVSLPGLGAVKGQAAEQRRPRRPSGEEGWACCQTGTRIAGSSGMALAERRHRTESQGESVRRDGTPQPSGVLPILQGLLVFPVSSHKCPQAPGGSVG